MVFFLQIPATAAACVFPVCQGYIVYVLIAAA